MPGKGQIATSQAQRGQEQVAVRSQPRGRAARGKAAAATAALPPLVPHGRGGPGRGWPGPGVLPAAVRKEGREGGGGGGGSGAGGGGKEPAGWLLAREAPAVRAAALPSASRRGAVPRGAARPCGEAG